MPLRLRELRDKAGLTLEKVAAELGVEHSSVQRWETGKRVPGADDLEKLAKLFKVHPGQLFDPPGAPPLNARERQALAIASELSVNQWQAWLSVGRAMRESNEAA